MTGGLIQIVAYGSQDLFLTGIPEITFFKYIYKRYTNFSLESIDIDFDGNKNFGQEISCNIPKNGDIIKDIFIKFDLPNVNIVKSDLDSNLIQNRLSDKLTAEDTYTNFKNKRR